ncbi:MAG: hypothetical protein QOJ96_3391 [Alphaproteobacteria bacterium]|jgi:hypothetical protein|nr:hypothetical protein [Alphaproteobacteria bacterium]
MDPSDAYYKTKRNLLIFVGCLLLAIFAGFKIVNNEQRLSVIPFQLERPEFLSTILFVIVAFNLFQLSIQWAAQRAEVQRNRFHRIDFVSSTMIGGLSILCYFWSVSYPHINWLNLNITGLATGTLLKAAALAAAFIATLYSSLGIEKISERFGRRIKRKAKSEDEALFQTLISNDDWILIFNPNSPNGMKSISFNADGTIGLGKNNNEATWRIKNGLLEILDLKDLIFSRFSYDSSSHIFSNTNDHDTRSLRSQLIVRNKDGLVRTAATSHAS